jgi:membrane-associated PAP2 superfamily phosphatase
MYYCYPVLYSIIISPVSMNLSILLFNYLYAVSITLSVKILVLLVQGENIDRFIGNLFYSLVSISERLAGRIWPQSNIPDNYIL